MTFYNSLDDGIFIIFMVYVNVMIVVGPNMKKKFKAQLARTFEMKDLGTTNQTLGIKIHKYKTSRKICLSENSYINNICSASICRMKN